MLPGFFVLDPVTFREKEERMSNWWLQWAERIALVLAEEWLRSKLVRGQEPLRSDPHPNPDPSPKKEGGAEPHPQ